MKTFSFFFSILLLSTSFAICAQKIDISEHGPDLMKAPFAIRYHFYNRYHKDWIYSTYEERRDFLTDWHQKAMEKDIKEKAQAKADKIEQREKEKLKKEEIKKEKDRIKAYQEEEKNAHKEFKAQGREFNSKVKSVDKELKRLQRESSISRQ